MTRIFITNNTQHYHYQAATKTSQDNGYAHPSLWHQTKMMVTVYLKQSFVQNLSQQKKSKLHEIQLQEAKKEKK